MFVIALFSVCVILHVCLCVRILCNVCTVACMYDTFCV